MDGTQFELGRRPVRRNNKRDWQSIWESAKAGNLEELDPQVLICHYGHLRRIGSDFSNPTEMERECVVYWGRSGTGKSRRAWVEAGLDAYPKDPRTKFWDGYRGQEHVVIDEFRGAIDIGHVLRWLDRYPVNVEIKGSATTLKAKKIWITSNLSPKEWYPGLDPDTLTALLRRLKVTHFDCL